MRLETLDGISLPNFSVRIMLSLLREHDLDASAALREAHIEPAQVESVDGRVSGRQELNFQHAFVRQTGHAPKLWVRTGLRYNLLSYGTYGLLITTARTVRRSVELASLFDDLNYSLMRYKPLLVEDKLVGLVMDASDAPDSLKDFCIYRALGSISAIHRENGGGDETDRSLELTVAEPEDAPFFESVTSSRIRFGASRNVWLWRPNSGDRELALGSALSEETYSRQCQEIIGHEKLEGEFVRRALSALVRGRGKYLTSSQLAEACSTSERTLHRRLAEYGTSYRALLDQVRYRQAKDLLVGTQMPVAQIATILGYSEVASLSRSFKRWSGEDPTRFRQARSG
jgi:AraC-like DNA-binding protein